ncbi:bifunctional metallophosphatase/5'-nucleotidase [Vibrio sp. SS-MA-C1-2]|uniref:bifunctional metallophosphatase/5'-nucleotidase n=1 Tax=Vibrio sp. SS-MA-C1-2 TaxID=2908646 RepID=UPI001F24E1AC|nr:bifunctional UDP-sugar hydrolase/5'-nucleotidase [Vibrio sp. SS-MA-C1-2]UJF16943.1 bifunctional metallophosphatase/5'-nucleotidase [Vibrio sp. SS-MA-C1-2]
MANEHLKLQINHINDTHSHFDPFPLPITLPSYDGRGTEQQHSVEIFVSCGGFARVKTALELKKQQAVKKGIPSLNLHGGDCFQGSLYFSFFHGEANAPLLNTLDLDGMVLGNHELDLGNLPVANFLDQVNFPFFSGNWNLSQEDESKANTLKNRKNGYFYNNKTQLAEVKYFHFNPKPSDNSHTIALFGLSIDQMAKIASPDPDTWFESAVEVAKNTVKALHGKGINNIVLLSHQGLELDKKLAQEVDGISLIVGGHSHTMQGDFRPFGYGNHGEYGIAINQTLILQAGCNTIALGSAIIAFSESGKASLEEGENQLLLGQKIFINAEKTIQVSAAESAYYHHYLQQQSNILFCHKDPQVEALLDHQYRKEIKELQQQHITHIVEPLRHVRIPDHKGGSQVGPHVAAGMLRQARELGVKADFAIHNAGGVRSSLPVGRLSAADIAGKLLPFAVNVVSFEITGKYIIAALEGAINNATNNGVSGTGTGSFPYTAELRFCYQGNKAHGRRMTNCQSLINGRWVDIIDDKNYTVVTTAFTAMGKEGYFALLSRDNEIMPLTATLADSFINYCKSNPTLGKIAQDLNTFIPCDCE